MKSIQPAKRQRVQLALDHFIAGEASEADLAVFRDPHFTYCASGEQACEFIGAAAGRSVPFDIYVIWANVLRHRYLVGRSWLKRNPTPMSTVPMQVPTIRLVDDDADVEGGSA